ncbi:hypothetical protein ABW20_dc0109376 [Dactylellina cionopaga]|nr:hypothetical protein ABW20_dc0109376 [Dactylellina cionopaga]
MASPPYTITFVNNSLYTFFTVIRPPFLLPANYTGYPTSIGPNSTATMTANGNANSIDFQVQGTYLGQVWLLVWAANDGATWHADAAWIPDRDTNVKNPPGDIHIVHGTAGSGNHTVYIEPGAPTRRMARNELPKRDSENARQMKRFVA